MNTPINYGRQSITEEDIEEVVAVLKSDYLTQGPKVPELEEAFARYTGAKYAIAVSNGTAALHLCMMALGVQPGDKVISTPITFSASTNAALYCGAEVVFADIDPLTYTIDIDHVRQLLESAPKGTYKGLIPVDFAGRSVAMDEFRALADQYNLWLLEDSCHAPGGYFIDKQGNEQLCGNGKWADLSIFSFHPVKHIATGEGGMVTTNNEALYKKIQALRTHGIIRSDQDYTNSIELAGGTSAYPGWYMEMQDLGYNYRLTDIQAALGISQLKRAKEGLIRRREIASVYARAFEGKPYVIGQSEDVPGHAYHLYILEVEDRLGLYNHLRAHKIYAQIHYIPVHLMPYYQRLGWKPGDFEKAEIYYSRCISLPMFPTLTEDQQQWVISCVEDYYNG